MSFVYRWTVPAAASGQEYVINSSSNEEVASGVVGAPDSSGGVAVHATLPEGIYTIEGVHPAWPGSSNPVGEIDILDSIANQPGAAETAKFIGTVTADTSGDSFDMVFAQDPDGIVDWAEEVAGNIKLTGPIQFHINARQGGTLDFTDATGFSTADTPPEVEGFVNYLSDTGGGNRSCWNDYKIPLGALGETFAIDAPLSSNSPSGPNFNSANHEVTISATVTAHGYDAAGDPVADGVYDAVFVVWVTKSELPDLPA